MTSDLAWIDAGRRFNFDDLVFWHGKGDQPFRAVAADIDTVVFGPHATAAFPAELQPFVTDGLSRRKQFDYSDVITASVGRAWVRADPRVAYVENPHSRLVMDPNRAPVDDAEPGLRRFFDAVARQRAGVRVSFAGMDAVRPITFSGEAVLREPRSEAEWAELAAALNECAEHGPKTYARVRDGLVEQVLAVRTRTAPLLVLSLHDTMNTQIGPSGAIVRERPVSDRLPWLANLGNRGDPTGDGPADELTVEASEIRRIADAFARAWAVPAAERDAAISVNTPYKGAFETVHWGARLRALGRPNIGAAQIEFRRETLLGPRATDALHQPGGDWPPVDTAHVTATADRLRQVGDLLRGV